MWYGCVLLYMGFISSPLQISFIPNFHSHYLPPLSFNPILFPSTNYSNKDDLDTLIPLTPLSPVPTGGGLGEWCCSGFIQQLSGYVILMGPVSPGSISWCPFSFSIPLTPAQSQVPLLLRVRHVVFVHLCAQN